MTPALLNNRYRIIKALGAGGFGETFLAEDTQMPSSRRCVIKQLKPVANNPQIYELVRERFGREAAILEELGEGNSQIPRLYAYFSEGDRFYLVQEWVDGETLSQKLETSGVMSESSVRALLVSMLPVLEFVHSKRIVHRDIKPDNIIVRRRDGVPVLIDFGAVKETMGTVVNSQGNATSSIVIGTPGFMPSEQAAGRPLYSSDLYSLGLTAIYLLTGKVPQELADPVAGEFVWHRHALSVSREFAAVLDKAIQFGPRERYTTAREMLDALQQPLQQPGVPVSRSLEVPAPAPSGGGDWQKTILTGSLIVGGLMGASIIIGLALNKSAPPPSEVPVAQQTAAPSVTPKAEPQLSDTLDRKPSVVGESSVTNRGAQQQTEDYSWLSDRAVTDTDLIGKRAFDLDIMRNSIFARHGRRFNDGALQSYFNSQPWYRPIYSAEDFPDSLLSPLEVDNAAYILEYQNRNGLR
ncbi:MAG: YARHG domain-containing protein [Oscillatoria princeps RMCB-10]|jgi:serine/threonine-protein kinase|nr:YARHG domain-containing protein [Oscillatoria princeps RMCB-10]